MLVRSREPSCRDIPIVDAFAKGMKLRWTARSLAVTTTKFVMRGRDHDEMRPAHAIRDPCGGATPWRSREEMVVFVRAELSQIRCDTAGCSAGSSRTVKQDRGVAAESNFVGRE